MAVRGHLIADREVLTNQGWHSVWDPARGEVVAEVPEATPAVVEEAVAAAARAGAEWRRRPVTERVQCLFRWKQLLEEHLEELAQLVTRHHGKTLAEARGEIRRGIEVVDFACGAPTWLQGRTLPEVSAGLDQDWYRRPVGIVACITPFNFPVMIPLWMVPLAVAAGNSVILKPSEKTPLAAGRLVELMWEAGFPPGVVNVVHGGAEVTRTLIQHPEVAAVSFVGSEPAAREVYAQAAAAGKRVQAAGGAKNHLVILEDADWDAVLPAVLNSAFGNAGERCLAGSVALGVGAAYPRLLEAVVESARRLKLGPGDVEGVDIGPLIRADHRERVRGYIAQGHAEGAELALDGRQAGQDLPGFFLGPTVLAGVQPDGVVAREEIFGPVLAVGGVSSLEEAVRWINASRYGNMAVLFTHSGKAARRFRETVECGMVGVNVGVAQPLAFYPFSGWKRSFYGDLHLHGPDGWDFYTRKQVVVTRW